jgi:hypothetical protein
MVNNQLGELLDCDVPFLRRIKDNQTQASEAKIALLAPWRGAKSDEGAGNGMMI